MSTRHKVTRARRISGIALGSARGRASLRTQKLMADYAEVCFGRFCFTIVASGLIVMLIAAVALVVLLYLPLGG